MPECKDVIYYVISVVGIMVTGYFSYLLYKVSQRMAEIADETKRIQERMSINDEVRMTYGK